MLILGPWVAQRQTVVGKFIITTHHKTKQSRWLLIRIKFRYSFIYQGTFSRSRYLDRDENFFGLRVKLPHVTTSLTLKGRGNSVKALPKDTTSKLAGLSSHCPFFMLNIKHRSCECQLLKSFGLTRPGNRTQVYRLNYWCIKFPNSYASKWNTKSFTCWSFKQKFLTHVKARHSTWPRNKNYQN